MDGWMSCFGAPVGCCCSQEAANGPVEWASPWPLRTSLWLLHDCGGLYWLRLEAFGKAGVLKEGDEGVSDADLFVFRD